MQLVVRRKLKDYDAWKAIVSQMDGMRRKYGSRGGMVYRSARDPNDVILVFDWDDSKPYTDYFNHPDVQKASLKRGPPRSSK